MLSFKKDDPLGDTSAHPAQLVVDHLWNSDEDNRKLHCRQLEAWYQEYVTSKGSPNIYRKPGFVSCPHQNTVSILIPSSLENKFGISKKQPRQWIRWTMRMRPSKFPWCVSGEPVKLFIMVCILGPSVFSKF